MYENKVEKGLENALEKRLHEMKDFPSYHRINIFEKGSLVGEEDVLQRKTYECTLKCHSGKGKVLRMHRDQFMQLKKEEVWKSVMTKIAFRDCRKEALDIQTPTKH